MKIVHWTLKNGSGMNRVAQEISDAEKLLGHNSIVLSSFDRAEWELGMDADIHVSHSHIPDPVRLKGGKIVWIGHGTPEHCFQTAVEDGLKGGYGHSDCLMLVQWWLQHADALVTFWPRHQKIWQSMVDKGRKVHCVPMGVDTSFWKPITSRGKYLGSPSIFCCENAHYIKWPLDLLIMWGWVTDVLCDAQLHLIYLPKDQHRWWFPLVNRNGSAFKSYITPMAYGKEDLRNAFNSVDYFVSFVRYGDFNRVCLEAKASGCKVISFEGNEYADFWITEGDQRRQADMLIKILKGEIQAEKTASVEGIEETAINMISIYEGIL